MQFYVGTLEVQCSVLCSSNSQLWTLRLLFWSSREWIHRFWPWFLWTCLHSGSSSWEGWGLWKLSPVPALRGWRARDTQRCHQSFWQKTHQPGRKQFTLRQAADGSLRVWLSSWACCVKSPNAGILFTFVKQLIQLCWGSHFYGSIFLCFLILLMDKRRISPAKTNDWWIHFTAECYNLTWT